MVPDDLPLPDGSRIVHIGPHKTGTTALQAAFWNNRKSVAKQGVHYASNGRHAMTAVLAGIEHISPWTVDKRPPPMWKWERLLNDIRSSNAKRVVLSSEFFADAKPENAARVVQQLDPKRVQIVVTLRPLSRILTSQWQQFVQNQNTIAFEEFLKKTLDDPHPAKPPVFWRRHRHDDLVKRWVDLVGPDHLTVVALNEGDRDMVLRAFEQITGLRTGTLEADPDDPEPIDDGARDRDDPALQHRVQGEEPAVAPVHADHAVRGDVRDAAADARSRTSRRSSCRTGRSSRFARSRPR